MDANNFNNKKEGIAHKVGETIEKLGQKISSAGASKIGKAISDAGDKIEHMNEEKSSVNPNHNKPVM